jgi:hypothetical protein
MRLPIRLSLLLKAALKWVFNLEEGVGSFDISEFTKLKTTHNIVSENANSLGK